MPPGFHGAGNNMYDRKLGGEMMDYLKITPLDLAKRFQGIKEVPGATSNPQILSMLRLDAEWPADDSVPWCSGFVNYIAWLLGLHRTKSLRARSWLNEKIVPISEAAPGFDLVVLKRGGGNQPGPDVINAPGHVGFFDRFDGDYVWIWGGNQSNTVNVSKYKRSRILGIRRLTV